MSYYRTQIGSNTTMRKRIIIVLLLFYLITTSLLLRLWRLQTAERNRYQQLATDNRTQTRRIRPPRGIISDRNGVVLVKNRAVFNATMIAEKTIPQHQKEQIAQLLELDPTELTAKLRKYRPKSYQQIVLKSGIDKKLLTIIEENPQSFPEVNILSEPRRDYVYGRTAAHAIGYLGEISESQLGELKERGIHRGDMIGQNGLERAYNDALQGTSGYKNVEVNAYGRELRMLDLIPPQTGDNLVLALDHRLQEAAEKALGDRNGACVVLDPRNGQILVMASKPAFDPNIFAAHISKDEWKMLFSDPQHPLYNRAIQSVFPPASTFKIVTAIAALDTGVITPEDRFTCWGSYRIGSHTYDCWKSQGHGYINVVTALRSSCNVFFYSIARDVGAQRIAQYARLLGLGHKTGIDLDNEKSGIVPDPDWKMRNYDEIWYPGNTVQLAIGQGYMLASPLQMANMMAIIATNGQVFQPQLALRIQNHSGKVITNFPAKKVGQIAIKPETLAVVKEGLWQVVNLWGTGRRAHISGMDIVGKTGTAQVIRKPKEFAKLDPEEIPIRFRPHGWFVSFAPLNAPELAMAIIVENGNEGSTSATPIAKAIYDVYFEGRKPDRTLEKFYRERADRQQKARQEQAKKQKKAQKSQPIKEQ